MKIALIGVGQGGGKITEAFIRYQQETNEAAIQEAIAVNTASADLRGLELVPAENRVLVGQADVRGNGVGADNELGAEVLSNDIEEVQNAIQSIRLHEIDAFLIVAALGGGTGSGGAPVIAEHLSEVYETPVYGLGVLPGRNEGAIYSLNAARSFKTFVDSVDNLFLFDNGAWSSSGETIEEGFERINEELVTRYSLLFNAGEAVTKEDVGESVVDASEIMNTLDSGGISSIGYASESVEDEINTGIISRLRGDPKPDKTNLTNRLTSLTRRATLGRLTLPAEVESAERALVVTSGHPRFLGRKGLERSRKWIEDETGSMEVRGGDYPIPEAKSVGTIVLLSGLSDIPRIKELQQVAIEAQKRQKEISQGSEQRLKELVQDQEDDIESLF